jgi:ferric-dicitrate binding protein FerR (iron transport regulator)
MRGSQVNILGKRPVRGAGLGRVPSVATLPTALVTLPDIPDAEYDRLARSVAGELTPAEQAEVDAWVAESAARGHVRDAVVAAWHASIAPPDVDVDAAWRKVTASMNMPRDVVVVDIASRKRRWLTSGVLMRAAAVLGLVAGTAEVVRRLNSDPIANSTLASAEATIETRAAERRSVTLPDGSQIELGVASTLRVAPEFGGTTRDVTLEGEAFFRVEHDAARPFRVTVRGVRVEDLGTEFSIRAYDSDTAFRVAVESGVVAVQTSAEPVVLNPHDVAMVSGQAVVSVSRNVDVSNYSAFAAGKLIFDNATLSQVFAELERWFDVDFRVTDSSVLGRRLAVPTGFDEGTSLDTVLQTIELSIGGGLHFMRSGERGRVIEVAAPARTGMSSGVLEQVGGGA